MDGLCLYNIIVCFISNYSLGFIPSSLRCDICNSMTLYSTVIMFLSGLLCNGQLCGMLDSTMVSLAADYEYHAVNEIVNAETMDSCLYSKKIQP